MLEPESHVSHSISHPHKYIPAETPCYESITGNANEPVMAHVTVPDTGN